MKARRFLQFSLRGFLIAVTVFAKRFREAVRSKGRVQLSIRLLLVTTGSSGPGRRSPGHERTPSAGRWAASNSVWPRCF